MLHRQKYGTLYAFFFSLIYKKEKVNFTSLFFKILEKFWCSHLSYKVAYCHHFSTKHCSELLMKIK